MKVLNVTIDGPQGVGKTQLAKFLAHSLMGMHIKVRVEDDGVNVNSLRSDTIPTLTLPATTQVIIRVEEPS